MIADQYAAEYVAAFDTLSQRETADNTSLFSSILRRSLADGVSARELAAAVCKIRPELCGEPKKSHSAENA